MRGRKIVGNQFGETSQHLTNTIKVQLEESIGRLEQ